MFGCVGLELKNGNSRRVLLLAMESQTCIRRLDCSKSMNLLFYCLNAVGETQNSGR